MKQQLASNMELSIIHHPFILLQLCLLAGPWTSMDSKYGYDYWYQPTHDVLISTEWGCPTAFGRGFSPEDLKAGELWIVCRHSKMGYYTTITIGDCMLGNWEFIFLTTVWYII